LRVQYVLTTSCRKQRLEEKRRFIGPKEAEKVTRSVYLRHG
jgi:hypothetical protein